MDNFGQIHRFDEVTEIRQVVQRFGFDVCYTQISPGQLEVESYEVRLGDCLVYREKYGCHMVAHGSSTPEGFGVMLAQSGESRFFGHDLSPKRVVLFPPKCEIDAVGFPGSILLHLLLPKDRLLAEAANCDVKLAQSSRALVVEPGFDRLHHLRSLMQQAAETLDRRDLAAWQESEPDLVALFLGLFDAAGIQALDPAKSSGQAAEYAIRVRDHIHLSPLDQLDMAALSRDLDVGRHHLNRCFREHFGVSIHEFVHLCRLHRARDFLAASTLHQTVTEVAYSCGFNHLGRFSTEYRQLFGETPSQTLGKAATST